MPRKYVRKNVATDPSVAYDKKQSMLVSKIERLENLLIASVKISDHLAHELEAFNRKYGM